MPDNIKSLQTTRVGGCSQAPFDTFNLAEHVEDNFVDVKKNRHLLSKVLPTEPKWLNQVHSDIVVDASSSVIGVNADGSFTTKNRIVSVVMTADCLPVLISNRQGTGVAAIHAGWRGLASGILEQGVKKLLVASHSQPEDLLVWFGPAIGPEIFEVGDDVRQIFLRNVFDDLNASSCFIAKDKTNDSKEIKWLADIYQLARLRLSAIGVENFFGGTYCTYKESDQFYSYRRDGKTGRMASLIWIE
ncbi:MAG: peptidoglycan editing factor PgeF [Gammaproteobacteria bacterium]|nr:peptidoglycan editing factor PgeF [Gammaproteobacteria bacterium]